MSQIKKTAPLDRNKLIEILRENGWVKATSKELYISEWDFLTQKYVKNRSGIAKGTTDKDLIYIKGNKRAVVRPRSFFIDDKKRYGKKEGGLYKYFVVDKNNNIIEIHIQKGQKRKVEPIKTGVVIKLAEYKKNRYYKPLSEEEEKEAKEIRKRNIVVKKLAEKEMGNLMPDFKLGKFEIKGLKRYSKDEKGLYYYTGSIFLGNEFIEHFSKLATNKSHLKQLITRIIQNYKYDAVLHGLEKFLKK